MIKDFEQGLDLIDLSTIDARAARAGDQAFRFIGDDNFHKKVGELHYVDKKNGNLLVEGDLDGDGKADFQTKVQNLDALFAGDFVL